VVVVSSELELGCSCRLSCLGRRFRCWGEWFIGILGEVGRGLLVELF
jgi:hypothetical protein